MGVSGQRHALIALYSKGKTTGIHWIGGWEGSRSSVDIVAKRKNPVLLRIESWSSSLKSSHSIY